jgi:hypothetical protein
MKCKIDITAETDLAAWVTRQAFMNNVDRDDLALRESEVVLDWYHPKWFRHDNYGDLRFTPPAFIFSQGQLRGINGRHRAVLLYRHLDAIPMLLVKHNDWPSGKIDEITQRKIEDDELIELPNLMINKTLTVPDESNISETNKISVKINISF